MDGATNPPPNVQSYTTWIRDWTAHLSGISKDILVPPKATAITTPLVTAHWQKSLAEYPNRALVHFYISGISQGFRLGFNNPTSSLRSARRNLISATEHPEVVEEYLAAEITQSRIIGPFDKLPNGDPHISRFGVIPKKHSQKWRLIVDLSHPAGCSINDGIPKDLCSLTYITVDTAINHIITLGPGTLLAKVDIKSAFRLLPVHPADRHLLVMRWKKQLYIDTCLPFGLRSAPKLFNILADFLAWILNQQGVSPVLHYLDDFLTMGQADSATCHNNFTTIQQTCQKLGIPLALEKLEGPSHSLTFLGIEIDTIHMEARLPQDKLSRISTQLTSWLGKRKATKREILSLVGSLQHASKVVRPGRTFTARMYSTAARVKELHHFTRLNKDFRSDLHWWYTFINNWNGLSFLRLAQHQPTFDYQIQTDASGAWGCGAFFGSQWFQLPWPAEWSTVGIMAKELVPIVISCAIWGPSLTRKRTEFQCDNMSLVTAINKGSAKDTMVMHLLRCLWFFTALFDIDIKATHIPGINNEAADMLSRNQSKRFLIAHPHASKFPTPLPATLTSLIAPQQLDWTSPSFRLQFQGAVSAIQTSSTHITHDT